MKYTRTFIVLLVLSFALTAYAHNGVDHGKGETHEEHEEADHASSSHPHDDPTYNLLSGIIYGTGFVISGGIVARDMKKNKK